MGRGAWIGASWGVVFFLGLRVPRRQRRPPFESSSSSKKGPNRNTGVDVFRDNWYKDESCYSFRGHMDSGLRRRCGAPRRHMWPCRIVRLDPRQHRFVVSSRSGLCFHLCETRLGRRHPRFIERLTELHPKRMTLDLLVTPPLLADVRAAPTRANECIRVPDVWSYLVSLERSCIYGQITLGYDGWFYAFPLSRATRMGNAAAVGIPELLMREEEQPFWRDGVVTRAECHVCQFRLACILCPAARDIGTDGPCALASQVFTNTVSSARTA